MSAGRLRARCPAKVNLRLRVLGRRVDGYHEIETLFQAVDLWDTLEAREGAGLTLTCDDPALPTDERNLVMRAAGLLAELGGRARSGVALHLGKRIPVGGGLGGGSSDAAGALLLLNRLWDLGLDTPILEDAGRRLGADVPFFLHGGTALGEDRGDRITRLPFRGPTPLILGIPPFGVSTAEAYSRLDAKLTPSPIDVSVKRPPGGKLSQGNDFRLGVNDLEAVVFEAWPELRVFRDELLRHGASPALLSGSGSTVFGIFEDPGRLREAGESLRSRFRHWRLIETRATSEAAHVG